MYSSAHPPSGACSLPSHSLLVCKGPSRARGCIFVSAQPPGCPRSSAGDQLCAPPSSLASCPHVLSPTPEPSAKWFPLQAPPRQIPREARACLDLGLRQHTSVLPWTAQPFLAGPPTMDFSLACRILLRVCTHVCTWVRVCAGEYAVYGHICVCVCRSVKMCTRVVVHTSRECVCVHIQCAGFCVSVHEHVCV